MPKVSGLLRDEKVTNDEGAIGHVDKVSRQKSPDPQAAGAMERLLHLEHT